MQPIVTLEVRAVAPPAPEFIQDIHGKTIPWHLLSDAALEQLAYAWILALRKRRGDAIEKERAKRPGPMPPPPQPDRDRVA